MSTNVFEQIDPCVLYLGTEDGLRVARVTASGLDVTAEAVAGDAVRAVAVHPDDPADAFVGCGLRGRGLYRTTDGGRTVERLGFEDRWVWGVERHPTDPETVYVGTEPPMLYRSDDGGETFEAFNAIEDLPSRDDWVFYHEPFGDGHVHGIGVHPDRPERIFAGVEDGAALYSHDGGDTWQETLVGEDVHRTVVDPADPDRVLAGCASGLFVSEDAGRTWTADERLRGEYVHGIAFDPHREDRVFLYASGDDPVYRSADRGATWEPVGEGLPEARPADPVRPHPTAPDVVFYAGGTHEGTLFASVDGGDSWERVADGLPKVWRLQAVPVDG